VLDGSFDDSPDAQGAEEDRLKTFRRVRDEIAERIIGWLKTKEASP
jgi:hypothetical protein